MISNDDSKTCVQAKDNVLIGVAFRNLGSVFKIREDYEKAVDCYKKFLEYVKRNADPLAEAQALDALANMYHLLGNQCALQVGGVQ